MTVLVLAGGVGGAKMADGFARSGPPDALLVCVNTADDFQHLGFTICPDLDTVTYTLAGIADPQRGWGLAEETWSFVDQIGRLGGADWFRLGDRDLATHVLRRDGLNHGLSLTEVTLRLGAALGNPVPTIPMTDDPVRTVVTTPTGDLMFQHYFVRERCAPPVRAVRFDGIDAARPNPRLLAALSDPGLAAVVLAPSNPFVSLDPILSLPGVRDALQRCAAPVVGVSPIVGGRALKGPAAKMMRELGLDPSPLTVVRRYADVLDGFAIDETDADLAAAVAETGVRGLVTPIVMRSVDDRAALADRLRHFAASLHRGRADR